MNVLFVCSQNKLRSPTAEQVFASWPGLSVDSAGVDSSATQPVSRELVSWADIIFLMEASHREKLRKKFRADLRNQRMVVLGIPDDYEFMDPALIKLLSERVPPFLPAHLQRSGAMVGP